MAKDSSSLWWHIGYSKMLMKDLREKEGVEFSAHAELLNLLRAMNKYRLLALGTLSFLFGLVGVLFILLLGSFTGLEILNIEAISLVGPASGLILAFFLAVWILTSAFRKEVSKILRRINTEELASYIE